MLLNDSDQAGPPAVTEPAAADEGPAALRSQLDALLTLTPEQLRARWHRDFRHRASPSISTQKLARAIAWLRVTADIALPMARNAPANNQLPI